MAKIYYCIVKIWEKSGKKGWIEEKRKNMQNKLLSSVDGLSYHIPKTDISKLKENNAITRMSTLESLWKINIKIILEF